MIVNEMMPTFRKMMEEEQKAKDLQLQAKSPSVKLSCPIKGGFTLFFALVDIGARRDDASVWRKEA